MYFVISPFLLYLTLPPDFLVKSCEWKSKYVLETTKTDFFEAALAVPGNGIKAKAIVIAIAVAAILLIILITSHSFSLFICLQ